jgi:hypothetical protein
VRAIHRLSDLHPWQTGVHQLIKRHRDVRAQQRLDLHRAFRCEPMRRAVQVRRERHAIVVDAPQIGEAEDLEAPGIGEDGPVPGHEPVEATQPCDTLGSRTQVEVIRVSEDDLGTRGAKIARRQRLDGGLRADRHERRRVDDAMSGLESARAGTTDFGRMERMSNRSGR